jgi:hypothetical protein
MNPCLCSTSADQVAANLSVSQGLGNDKCGHAKTLLPTREIKQHGLGEGQ